MREVRATMARLWAEVMAWMSPVKFREYGVSGMHWARPPPAAEPFMPMVGPPEGWRMAAVVFTPRLERPCTRPMVVVDLPSPRGVGVMAVTSTYLPLGLSARRRNTACCSILPM